MNKDELKKIEALCISSLMPLDDLRQRNKSRYLTNLRTTLAAVLIKEFNYSAPSVGSLLNRCSSNYRILVPMYIDALEFDKEIKTLYSSTVNEAVRLNLKPFIKSKRGRKGIGVKLIKLDTKEVYNFKSKTEACAFLKINKSMLNYYFKNKIDNFLGYKIIYN